MPTTQPKPAHPAHPQHHTLEASHNRLYAAVNSLPVACFGFDKQGRIYDWNPACETIFGITADQVLERPFCEVLSIDSTAPMSMHHIQHVFEGQSIEGVLWAYGSPNGSQKALLTHILPMRIRGVEITGAMSSTVDVTEYVWLEESLRESQEILNQAVDAMSDGFVLVDNAGKMRIWNRPISAWTGEASGFLAGCVTESVLRFVDEDAKPIPDSRQPIRKAIETGAQQSVDCIGLIVFDGTIRWLSLSASPIFGDGHDSPQAAVVLLRDITERRELERSIADQMKRIEDANRQLEFQQRELEVINDRLEKLATTDGLTGLLNHRAFNQILQSEMATAVRKDGSLSIIFLDIDHFKSYNDSFGHVAGDRVLEQFAKVLKRELRSSDHVARYGGEEFGIIVPSADEETACRIAEHLRDAMRMESWPNRSITASIGVAQWNDAINSEQEFVNYADLALYAAKANGRDRVVQYSSIAEPDEDRRSA